MTAGDGQITARGFGMVYWLGGKPTREDGRGQRHLVRSMVFHRASRLSIVSDL